MIHGRVSYLVLFIYINVNIDTLINEKYTFNVQNYMNLRDSIDLTNVNIDTLVLLIYINAYGHWFFILFFLKKKDNGGSNLLLNNVEESPQFRTQVQPEEQKQ